MLVPGAIERIAPFAIIVMGVSGSGKSTLGTLLADRLGCRFLEGDHFHSEANVEKMRHGTALTDLDRWPWLDALGRATGDAVARDGLCVVACSALKRSYRDRLASAIGTPLMFALLETGRRELERRLADRPGHYMPVSLLDSQLCTLERPGADEPALVMDADEAPQWLADQITGWINQRREVC
jgi:gluconokinase